MTESLIESLVRDAERAEAALREDEHAACDNCAICGDRRRDDLSTHPLTPV